MSRRTTKKSQSTGSTRSGALGIILIALGALFLFDNMDLIPYEVSYYLFNWKGILVLIGAVLITTKPNKNPGIIMLAIGLFFITSDILSYEFDWRWYDTRKLFWPVLLIVIGLIILSRKGSSPLVGVHVINAEDGSEKEVPNDADHLNVTAALGGGDMTINSKNFKGGKVTTVMGGGTYDLSAAELADGTQEIDLLILMGGANFIVPSDWNVRLEVTSIFGGFTDRRKLNADDPKVEGKELLIKGTVLFGGGEVKNFV